MDQFGKIRQHRRKERHKISEIAKCEHDLLKTNEDIAFQSGKILQTFLWWRHKLSPLQTCENFRRFSDLYLDIKSLLRNQSQHTCGFTINNELS